MKKQPVAEGGLATGCIGAYFTLELGDRKDTNSRSRVHREERRPLMPVKPRN
jgi:hypothetical protein